MNDSTWYSHSNSQQPTNTLLSFSFYMDFYFWGVIRQLQEASREVANLTWRKNLYMVSKNLSVCLSVCDKFWPQLFHLYLICYTISHNSVFRATFLNYWHETCFQQVLLKVCWPKNVFFKNNFFLVRCIVLLNYQTLRN